MKKIVLSFIIALACILQTRAQEPATPLGTINGATRAWRLYVDGSLYTPSKGTLTVAPLRPGAIESITVAGVATPYYWDGTAWREIWKAGKLFTLSGLDDVDTAGLTTGDMIIWDGSNWVRTPAPTGGGGAELDPTVGAHIKAITSTNINNWNTAFGWGNHATAGYVTGNLYTVNGTISATREVTVSGSVKFRDASGNNYWSYGPTAVDMYFDNGTNWNELYISNGVTGMYSSKTYGSIVKEGDVEVGPITTFWVDSSFSVGSPHTYITSTPYAKVGNKWVQTDPSDNFKLYSSDTMFINSAQSLTIAHKDGLQSFGRVQFNYNGGMAMDALGTDPSGNRSYVFATNPFATILEQKFDSATFHSRAFIQGRADSAYYQIDLLGSASSQGFLKIEESEARKYLTMGYNPIKDSTLNSKQILMDDDNLRLGIRTGYQFGTTPTINGLMIDNTGRGYITGPVDVSIDTTTRKPLLIGPSGEIEQGFWVGGGGLISDEDFAHTNLTADADRTHDFANNWLKINNLRELELASATSNGGLRWSKLRDTKPFYSGLEMYSQYDVNNWGSAMVGNANDGSFVWLSARRPAGVSELGILPQSITLNAYLGQLYADTLNLSSGANQRMTTWDITTGQFGYQAIPSGQPLDADLSAIAALTGTGIARRTGADTWSVGTLTSADIPLASGQVAYGAAGGTITSEAGFEYNASNNVLTAGSYNGAVYNLTSVFGGASPPGTGGTIWVRSSDNHLMFTNSATTTWDLTLGGTGGGSGTVNSGTQYRLAYYAATGDAVSQAAAITVDRALISDANGVPTHSTVTATELGYLSGATSSIQTQLGTKQPQLNGTGLVRMAGTTVSYDNATYLTSYTETDPDYDANGEKLVNKATDFTTINNTKYPTTQAVVDYLDAQSSDLFFTWPLRIQNTNEVYAPIASATADGWLDSLDWSHFDEAYDKYIASGTHNSGTGITTFTRRDGTTFNVTGYSTGGGSSYTFQHSLVEASNVVNLVGDVATPGNNKVYGTDGTGARGYQSAAVISLTSPTNGDILVYNNGVWENQAPGSGSYTDEQAQDAVGAMVSSEFTYTDATPLLAINTIAASKITGLATVATTGAYSDLTGIPSNLVTTTGTQTLTNKTITFGGNTVTGTLAEFNTAVTDANLASLAGTETLTNKTFNWANNTVSMTTAQLNTALSDNDVATLTGTETLTNKTLSGASNTINNLNGSNISSGTVASARLGSLEFSRGIKFIAPTASENQFILRAPDAITIQSIDVVIAGTSPSVTYAVHYGSTYGTSLGTVVASNTVTTVGTATVATSSISANHYLWLVTSGTSGTVTDFSVQVNFIHQ